MTQDRRKATSKSEKNLKDAPLPPLPFAHQVTEREESITRAKEVKRITQKEDPLTVEEAATLLKNVREKGEELKRKLEELYRLRGITPDYLHAYMSNPSNFTSQQWEFLKKERQALIDSLNLPPDVREKQTPSVSSSTDSKKSTKSQRGKGSAHRRGWIPMR